ncbi:hypothetical protein [Streptomyces himalayensis]|nr:hypothetical protein [Streptomyces himalayensis]
MLVLVLKTMADSLLRLSTKPPDVVGTSLWGRLTVAKRIVEPAA